MFITFSPFQSNTKTLKVICLRLWVLGMKPSCIRVIKCLPRGHGVIDRWPDSHGFDSHDIQQSGHKVPFSMKTSLSKIVWCQRSQEKEQISRKKSTLSCAAWMTILSKHSLWQRRCSSSVSRASFKRSWVPVQLY